MTRLLLIDHVIYLYLSISLSLSLSPFLSLSIIYIYSRLLVHSVSIYSLSRPAGTVIKSKWLIDTKYAKLLLLTPGCRNICFNIHFISLVILSLFYFFSLSLSHSLSLSLSLSSHTCSYLRDTPVFQPTNHRYLFTPVHTCHKL